MPDVSNKPVLFDGATTFDFATEAVNQFPPVTGTVRPATGLEVRQHDARMAAARSAPGTPEDVSARVYGLQARHFAHHVKTWNVDLPITEEAMKRLPIGVFAQFDAIVAGLAGFVPKNSADTSSS